MSDSINWAELLAQSIDMSKFASLPSTVKLPALPHAVTRFMERANDPSADIKELAQIIETDSGLTLELLRHVNSASLGLRHRANNVRQALALLGVRRSKNFVISTGMQAAVTARKSKLINQTCFWNASLQKALFARDVADMLETDAETAFFGSLLQDYLLPVLTNDLFQPYVDFVESRIEQPETLSEYERSHFGWDHALAAAGLATRWHLPDDLVCCILFHHHGLVPFRNARLKHTPVTAVAISALLPDQMRQQYRGLEMLIALESEWPEFDLQALAEEVDRKQETSGLGVRNDFPLARRCQNARSEKRDYKDGSLKTAALA
ncbi:MAG: HDOD domain-containing protein [Planctomycetota bacterium]|nr:HDOD domain-containing protein [Planctomycetota bacterium]